MFDGRLLEWDGPDDARLLQTCFYALMGNEYRIDTEMGKERPISSTSRNDMDFQCV